MQHRTSPENGAAAGPHSMSRLLELVCEGDTFDALRLILDNCPQFFQEFYTAVPDYRDGLSFADDAMTSIQSRKAGVPLERYMRWDICLISLKLEMLDKLGCWADYRKYFLETYKKHPNYQGTYKKTASHLKLNRASPYYLGEDEQYFYAHFLYLLLPRFEAINKVLGLSKGTVKRPAPVCDAAAMKRGFMDMAARLRLLLGLEKNILKKQSR